MRPLDKGTCPQENGKNKIVSEYSQWRQDLIESIGYFCAYCNMPLSHSLQVEHVIPKNPQPGNTAGAILDWDNMLLACGPCNNAKSNTPVNYDKYYFPEENNTLLCFEIAVHDFNKNAAIVKARSNLKTHQTIKANSMIGLVDLANIDTRQGIVDIRWKKRRNAMIAVDAQVFLFNQIKQMDTYDPIATAKAIAVTAREIGFFGLWFAAFSNEPIVIEKLIDTIPGTAKDCFDSSFQLINRNPNNAIDPI